jgi:phosphate acetyltransferase
MPLPESATLFIGRQVERLQRVPRLGQERLIESVLLPPALPDDSINERYAALFFERRRAKGVTQFEAVEIARIPLYQAALMLAAGVADGAVGGAVNTTAETVRAGFSRSPAPGIQSVSGVFFTCVQDRTFGRDGTLAFADCAITVDPSTEEVARIATTTACSAQTVSCAEPKVALLSFSTKGSVQHPRAAKTAEALSILLECGPESRRPIFPDLGSANIAYKLVERLGGAAACRKRRLPFCVFDNNVGGTRRI